MKKNGLKCSCRIKIHPSKGESPCFKGEYKFGRKRSPLWRVNEKERWLKSEWMEGEAPLFTLDSPLILFTFFPIHPWKGASPFERWMLVRQLHFSQKMFYVLRVNFFMSKKTCLVNLNVWRANSLVGDIMSARGPLEPDLFSFSCKRCNMGSKKAAVLPLPVLAMATTSLPSNISGIA